MNHPATIRRGFTLIELLVSISIMVLVILGVAMVFRSTGSAVGLSQANMEMLSNVRAFQQQFDQDVQHLDRNGFMVIRQFRYNMVTSTAPIPSTPPVGTYFDQISFTALGSFQHKTGTVSVSAPLADGFAANSAVIWYGHLAFEVPGAASQNTSAYPPPSPTTAPPVTDDNAAGFLRLNASNPNAPSFNTVDASNRIVWQSCTLGRRAFLLAPNTGSAGTFAVGPTAACAAYPSVAYSKYYTPQNGWLTVLANNNSGIDPVGAHITASRIDAVAQTPAQLMQEFWTNQATANWVVNNYCYRSKSLRNVNDGPSLANGAFRMHDQILQGCTHIEIAWTNGSANTVAPVGTAAHGQCVWYGTGNAAGIEPTPVSGDSYDVAFPVIGNANATLNGFWPKALRITIWVTDPNDRLKGGREFIQYVHLPS